MLFERASGNDCLNGIYLPLDISLNVLSFDLLIRSKYLLLSFALFRYYKDAPVLTLLGTPGYLVKSPFLSDRVGNKLFSIVLFR